MLALHFLKLCFKYRNILSGNCFHKWLIINRFDVKGGIAKGRWLSSYLSVISLTVQYLNR